MFTSTLLYRVRNMAVLMSDGCYYMVITLPAGAVAKYCDEHVCLCMCLSVCPRDISGTICAIFISFSVHVAYGRGSVLLWQVDEIPRGRDSFGYCLPLFCRATCLCGRKMAQFVTCYYTLGKCGNVTRVRQVQNRAMSVIEVVVVLVVVVVTFFNKTLTIATQC